MAFHNVIGHRLVVELLQRALVNQRVNHAYLFVGSEGVGKEFTAIQYAKALNCLKLVDESCGECLSCKKFESGNHPDFRVIRPEENSIRIEQIRALQKDLVYRPYESKWKIYIIDNAEMMTLEAANSLLKTLEEPPQYAVIILITAQKDGILPTLISRSQVVQFSKLSRDELRIYLQSQELAHDKLDLEEIVLLAEGSIGQAYRLIEDNQIWDERRVVLELLSTLTKRSNLEIYETIQSLKLEKDLRQWDRLFRIVKTFYRDLMIMQNMDTLGESETQLIINKSYIEQMSKVVKQFSPDELEKVIKLIEKTNNDIKANIDRELALEVMLHKIKARRV